MSQECPNSIKEYASVIREMIRHENELTNSRFTWMLIAQGIFFGAASNFWNAHWAPFVTIACVGIAIATSVFYSLWLTTKARIHLRELYLKKLNSHPELLDTIPPVAGDVPNALCLPWANPWMLIPWMIAGSWLLLIILRLNIAPIEENTLPLENSRKAVQVLNKEPDQSPIPPNMNQTNQLKKLSKPNFPQTKTNESSIN